MLRHLSYRPDYGMSPRHSWVTRLLARLHHDHGMQFVSWNSCAPWGAVPGRRSCVAKLQRRKNIGKRLSDIITFEHTGADCVDKTSLFGRYQIRNHVQLALQSVQVSSLVPTVYFRIISPFRFSRDGRAPSASSGAQNLGRSKDQTCYRDFWKYALGSCSHGRRHADPRYQANHDCSFPRADWIAEEKVRHSWLGYFKMVLH